MTPAKKPTLREHLSRFDGKACTLIGRICGVCGLPYFLPANVCGSQMRDCALYCPACGTQGADSLTFSFVIEKTMVWEDGVRATSAIAVSK